MEVPDNSRNKFRLSRIANRLFHAGRSGWGRRFWMLDRDRLKRRDRGDQRSGGGCLLGGCLMLDGICSNRKLRVALVSRYLENSHDWKADNTDVVRWL